MDPTPPFFAQSRSTDSLEESLLPSRDTEAEIIFTPKMPTAGEIPATPVRLGGADLGAPGHAVNDVEEEGMIMGPSHPIFTRDHPSSSSSDLPVPPGARFDPISPVGPGFYSSGDPDFDELIPPGLGQNPLGPSIRPPHRKGSSGSKTFPKPSFGHPHGAPPGPGNPPFFM